MNRGCDLLLLVATRTELEQLKAAAEARGLQFDRCEDLPSSLKGDQNTAHESYWMGELGRYRTIAVKTGIGALGYRGSAASALHHATKTGATHVLCVGMAFGISRQLQAFGDVIVAEAVFPYDRRDVVSIPEQGWKYDYPQNMTPYRTNPELLRILKAYVSTMRERREHRVMFGCLLTGSARIRSATYRDKLFTWCDHIAPGILGGEMEGIGLLALTPKPKPNWMIVKGICDFADGHQVKDVEANRALACRNAASFVLDALAAWMPDPTETIMNRREDLHGAR